MLDGDVYARPPHAGRGGWSWYTGSAGWLYRAGLESILGLRRRGDHFTIDAVRAVVVGSLRDRVAHLDTSYEIVVNNPDRRVDRRAARASSTASTVDHRKIPLVNDGATHTVQITMGGR